MQGRSDRKVSRVVMRQVVILVMVLMLPWWVWS